MDDEEETYRLWKIRKTIMQVNEKRYNLLYVLSKLSTIRSLRCFYCSLFDIWNELTLVNRNSQLIKISKLSVLYNNQYLHLLCSSVTIVVTWWRKMNWIRPSMSSEVSLETNPVRVDRDEPTSPCWSPTTTIQPTRCLFSSLVCHQD